MIYAGAGVNDKCFSLAIPWVGGFDEVPRNNHGGCHEEFDLGAQNFTLTTYFDAA